LFFAIIKQGLTHSFFIALTTAVVKGDASTCHAPQDPLSVILDVLFGEVEEMSLFAAV
jgi:hypothetical protein